MRSMAQVSNLPVVLIESDREDDSDGTRGRPAQFDWDSLKIAVQRWVIAHIRR